MRTLTVLFADIAGFTGLSERLGDRIIPLLSSFLDTMSREVSANSGTIDKFIGDAVMAILGRADDEPRSRYRRVPGGARVPVSAARIATSRRLWQSAQDFGSALTPVKC